MASSISFIPQEVDLNGIYQGGTMLLICAATDADNNPIDMTGGSVQCIIRSAQVNTSTLIATPTVTWVNQSTGHFNLSLTSTQTLALNFTSAFWDCVFIDSNTPPNVYPLWWGNVTMQNTENASY
jgi:hypothetical protein